MEINFKSYNRNFGAYILVNTIECESWTSIENLPAVHSVERPEDCDFLGVDYDRHKDIIDNMKIGEVLSEGFEGLFDYEGVYIMRVG